MKTIVGIYKITSPSGKIYIGQSKNILYRWRYFYEKLHCKRQLHLYNSLKKYGVTNHKFEILKECLIEELNNFEIYYISFYNSTNKLVGLNHREGGNGKIICEATRLKMRNNALGNTNMLGKKHSIETRKLISTNRKGIKPSSKTREKMSNARKGFKHSIEVKEKLSKANKFTSKIKNMKTNNTHKSITQAAIDENISQSTIYRGLKDGRYEYI